MKRDKKIAYRILKFLSDNAPDSFSTPPKYLHTFPEFSDIDPVVLAIQYRLLAESGFVRCKENYITSTIMPLYDLSWQGFDLLETLEKEFQ